jgi:signal peptidase II
MTMRLQNAIWFMGSTVVILLDQISKWVIDHFLTFNQPVSLLPIFNLYYTVNDGAAFSFLSSQPELALWIFSGIAAVVSVSIAIWMLRIPSNHRLILFSLSYILGGAIGNLIDRVRLGHVVDFLQLHYQDYYWPVFNIADSAIVIGATLLVIDSLWHREKV